MPKGDNPNSRANLEKGKATRFRKGDTQGKKEAATASNKAQAAKRTLQKEMQAALDTLIKNNQGQQVTVRNAIVLAQVAKALKGDSKAFANCGEYSGEKPADKQQVFFDKPNKFIFVLKK